MHPQTPLQKPIDKGATILVEINVSSKENDRFSLFDRFKSSDPSVGLNTFSEMWPVFPKRVRDCSSYDSPL